MNSTSIDFKFFIESDSTPFILFDSSGKILYLNSSSEILLGYVTRQELYDITLSYAPKDFGSKVTRLDLQYDSFSFYAIGVAYQNEEQIALRLYHKPKLNINKHIELDKLPMTDINILLEANITLFKLKNSNQIQLLIDQDLPECRIDQNKFSKLLRKVLDSFRSSDSIDISLKLLIGEYVIIRNKKEHLLELVVKANGRYTDSDLEIRSISEQINISANLREHLIKLQIPFVQ
ncbi:hypothetical protein MNB_SV-6-81 [hydrothermal vent metagenome]|uniref:PAS domain-containing protein n=1 Tax=hydrothermal vent metagenome TaxID=652676 RepID=A0A1W1BK82_9ZZZZ